MQTTMADSDRPAFEHLPDGLIRTTYDMLLYGFEDADVEPPLSPGSLVRIGPRCYRVLREEPETATVLLAPGRLLWRYWARWLCTQAYKLAPNWWLRRLAWRVARQLERWAEG
jgi:hypothetical protein